MQGEVLNGREAEGLQKTNTNTKNRVTSRARARIYLLLFIFLYYIFIYIFRVQKTALPKCEKLHLLSAKFAPVLQNLHLPSAKFALTNTPKCKICTWYLEVIISPPYVILNVCEESPAL